MRSLRQCLLDTDLARLKAIAAFWDVELTTSRQRDVAIQLAEVMATPEAAANAWSMLPDDQRQTLEALLANRGRMPLRVFARQWGEIRAMGPGRMEREKPWRAPDSATEGLWYAGFIFRAFEQAPGGSREVVFVPAEVMALLPTSPAPHGTIALKPISEPLIIRSAGETFLDDACEMLAYVQSEQVRPGHDGAWPARHEAHLAHRLQDSDPERPQLLHSVVRRLGWLRVSDSGYLRPDPEPVSAWLHAPTDRQRAALADAWRSDPTWNDLFHVPTLRPEDTGAWRNDPLLAREAVMRHLKTCTPGAWHGLDDLVSAIRQADPDFQRPDGDYAHWYIRDAATGTYLSGFESWDAVEGALIRYLVMGPLAWLGLTDLGTCRRSTGGSAGSSDGAAPFDSNSLPSHVFRLTTAGAAYLGLVEPPAEPETTRMVLRSDFTVLAPPTPRYERFQLSRIADWVRTGSRYVYRLSPTSLEHARQQGIPVARVLAYLKQVSGAPAPRPIEAALTRWDERGAEARLQRAVLLRTSSPELMEEVVSSTRIRRFIRERIGPTAVLIREQEWPRIAAALGDMGLLPEVIDLREA